jgi:DNA invertase Pin-like site-specific DNA recombinase
MSVTGNLIPAGVWVRVSTGGQDEANQVPEIEKHCAARGYAIVKRYTVQGKHQPDLDKMLADMRAGVIKVLVVWHSDRIERRPGKALLDLLAEVDAAGGRMESVKEPTLGQLDFGAQVTTFIAGLVNAEKSLHLSEQVGAALEKIRESGAFHGKVPWGYVTAGEKYARKLVPANEGRRLVPEMYRRAAKGHSTQAIADWLAAETGRPWWPRTVGAMIRNPVYAGMRCGYTDHGRRTHGEIVHRCEALVPADLWKRANNALDNRPGRGPALPQRAMLTGVITCLRCEDSPMYRVKTGKPGSRGAYYRCHGRGAGRKSCGNMVPLELPDRAVSLLMAKYGQVKIMERRVIAGSHHEAELAEIEIQMDQLDKDASDYITRLTGLHAERTRIKALPAPPDKVQWVPTGQTLGQLWAAAGDDAARNDFLRGQGSPFAPTAAS